MSQPNIPPPSYVPTPSSPPSSNKKYGSTEPSSSQQEPLLYASGSSAPRNDWAAEGSDGEDDVPDDFKVSFGAVGLVEGRGVAEVEEGGVREPRWKQQSSLQLVLHDKILAQRAMTNSSIYISIRSE